MIKEFKEMIIDAKQLLETVNFGGLYCGLDIPSYGHVEISKEECELYPTLTLSRESLSVSIAHLDDDWNCYVIRCFDDANEVEYIETTCPEDLQ